MRSTRPGTSAPTLTSLPGSGASTPAMAMRGVVASSAMVVTWTAGRGTVSSPAPCWQLASATPAASHSVSLKTALRGAEQDTACLLEIGARHLHGVERVGTAQARLEHRAFGFDERQQAGPAGGKALARHLLDGGGGRHILALEELRPYARRRPLLLGRAHRRFHLQPPPRPLE